MLPTLLLFIPTPEMVFSGKIQSKTMAHILIVEADRTISRALRKLLERHEFTVSECQGVKAAKAGFELDALDVIITNLRLPDQPGTTLSRLTSTPVLVMTSYASMSSSVEAKNIGAVDYLSIPLDHDVILGRINQALAEKRSEISSTSQKTKRSDKPVGGMIGTCPAMTELFRRIRKVALTQSPVLIQGESGTGKELVARALHESSTRREANLVSVNCAAIPEKLIESELFGHEKDAFQGATTIRTGLVEDANNGTIFLDEISELPLDAQARLLRVLQEHEIRKVGSVQSLQVDVRLVAATHRDLTQLVQEGRFREDLYYRINVMPLQIPPLRERGTDILELADLKLAQYCDRLDIPHKHFSADAIQAITTYPWPGNVRELENVIERAVVMTEENKIPIDLLGLDVSLVKIALLAAEEPAPASTIGSEYSEKTRPEDLSLKEYFQQFVLEHQDQMNETELAKKLGISRKCLWERRQRFNIPRKKKSA